MERKRLIGQLDVLYRERYRQFLRVATAIAGDEDAGHDAVQEGFARALKSARAYRGDGTGEGGGSPRPLRSPPPCGGGGPVGGGCGPVVTTPARGSRWGHCPFPAAPSELG